MKLIKNIQAASLGEDIGSGTNAFVKDGKGFCPDGVCDWAGIVSWITTVLFFFATVSSFIFLILGAIGFITAGGDRGKIESARNKMIFALIGLIIVAASFAIWKLVLSIIGVEGNIETGL